MRWIKRGVIYRPNGSLWWARSHAYAPTPELRGDDTIRLYITCRDEKGIGRIGSVDVSASDPSEVRHVAEAPHLDIGVPGTFDENGVFATSVVDRPDGRKCLYYVGFELGRRIPYRLLTGLAISEDGGQTFRRWRTVPILERSASELLFRCGPHVVHEDGVFRMWYIAGSGWTEVDGKTLPVYEIRYAESKDGFKWPEEGRVVLPLTDPDEHGFGRPWVMTEGGSCRMFYSIRKRSARAYRLGYAESTDGLAWRRKDAELGLDVSPSGWDSQAMCYSSVIRCKFGTYLFYNGNGMGETGFGYAVLAS